ncbi:MAG: FAD-dependent oxidoreductase [Bradymonadaceae bacterium]|nr:FAD-dependent oxidoreductase [Lujinxingiaceae bacterium]
MKTKYLVIGAGMSGLAFANFIDSDDYLVLERDEAIGGWCKTIKREGFVWDYSGHFFHFKHPDIEAYLRARMPDDEVVTVEKLSKIIVDQSWIDFPFQKNIHQLPKEQFIDCLYDLYFRNEAAKDFDQASFKGMLYEKFGRSISEMFLVPYNEKLYACDLEQLDRDAMGRFFPHADLEDIVRNMRRPDNASYNASFTYPKNGAIMYVNALKSEVPDDRVLLGEGIVKIDLAQKIATTTLGRTVAFEYLISSAPFNRLLELSALPHDPATFSYNKVLCFNLGFDRKGPEDVHWVYFPEHKYSFYRVGFYDNILNTERMSLYVELGYAANDVPDVEAARTRVLADLREAGIVSDHELVAHHDVVLDPAYVHITRQSREVFERLSGVLALRGVHTIGRYGGWTYCSIEDNIVEARALAARFNML